MEVGNFSPKAEDGKQVMHTARWVEGQDAVTTQQRMASGETGGRGLSSGG